MSAENAVISELLHTDIRHVLATLDEREQQVIRLRFGLDDGQPRTLDQIGKLFGLSRERVRQIEREVMAKLRNGERAERSALLRQLDQLPVTPAAADAAGMSHCWRAERAGIPRARTLLHRVQAHLTE